FVNWDDRAFLLENWMIRSLDAEHLKAMATSFKTGNWHPLTWLSHALDYRMFGTHPAGHHFTSLLWHAFN
ncbi:MAG: hypothetical protein GWM98_18815, partial [Nitrospinaceae bacterium]|nr:hypothetical protein [Nitrospinaceae bacterium]NIR56159.1 hypothetical protein [Nitrospinaceae bacterium]NIS86615.1 hypothetical protein [Nitrospinaceae bacterium]NIT83445.1 hypothetical protein [Nitrospinaceae bacterium]NIU45653.1 hypothetical protein [Nitrospinaceae bacterium]